MPHARPSPTTPRLHLGVDDVFATLVAADDAREPPLAPPFFAALAKLHAEFGIDIDMYLFLEGEVDGERRSLAHAGARVRDRLVQAPWLRLGPHGLDHEHPPYRLAVEAQRATFTAIYREIDRLVGRHRRSRVVRLHCFSESFALADYWREQGVESLLLTDRDAVAYHLPDDVRRELAARGSVAYAGLIARRTHERLENLAEAGLDEARLWTRLEDHVARHDQLVLCTHEAEITRPDVLAIAASCLRYARARGMVPM